MGMKARKKLLSMETVEWARECYSAWIDEVYDDPCVGSCAQDYIDWIELARRVGKDIGLVFDDVVKEEALSFEIAHFDKRCNQEWWDEREAWIEERKARQRKS